MGLIVWLLLSNVGELSAVVEALENVSLTDAILLVVLPADLPGPDRRPAGGHRPGLGLARGMVAVESAAAASNVIPGPSGTATRLAVLRSWGFYTEDFARSWLFTSSLTNFTVLAMPAVAVVLVAIDNDVPGRSSRWPPSPWSSASSRSGSWCASCAASASPAAPGC